MNIKPGMYKHYKGTLAKVIGVAKHTETKEEYVVYEHVEKETGKNQLWVRPKTMFLETVTVDGKTLPRFEYVSDTVNSEVT